VLKGFTQATLLGIGISPRYETITYSETQQFSAAGGVAPYTFSKVAGPGSITVGGLFTPDTSGAAPDAPLSTVIRVTDANLNTADTLIYTTSDLAITPSIVQEIYYSDTVDFDAVGGNGPYNFTNSGAGGVDSGTGIYTAPAAGGTQTATVMVEDSEAFTATSGLITTYPTFSVSPAGPITIGADTTQQFTSTGGKSPIVWSKQSGSGSINSSGLYTAAAGADSTAVIRGTDALSTFQDVTVNVLFEFQSLLGDNTAAYADIPYAAALDKDWDEPFSITARLKLNNDPIVVPANKSWIDWVDDEGPHSCQIPPGNYATLNDFIDASMAAMQAENLLQNPGIQYTSDHFKFTNTSVLFSILWDTGPNAANSAQELFGFSNDGDSVGNSGGTGYTGSDGVFFTLPNGTITSNIDGAVSPLKGIFALLETYDQSDATYRPAVYLLENYDINLGIIVRTNDTVSANEIVRYGMTYDGSGDASGVKLYINEVPVAMTVELDTLTKVGSITTLRDLWIGGAKDLNNFLGGWVSEIALWNKQLSDAEIEETVTPAGLPSDLSTHSAVADLEMWIRPEPGATGGVVPDASGNGHDATLRNGMTVSTDVT
jgi:hypothetical protein